MSYCATHMEYCAVQPLPGYTVPEVQRVAMFRTPVKPLELYTSTGRRPYNMTSPKQVAYLDRRARDRAAVRARIVGVLRELGEVLVGRIADMLGVPRANLYKHLCALETEGVVTRRGERAKTTWRLT